MIMLLLLHDCFPLRENQRVFVRCFDIVDPTDTIIHDVSYTWYLIDKHSPCTST